MVIYRYESPVGLLPGSSRYVSRMGYHQKTVAAALVTFTVKGLADIKEAGRESSLTRPRNPADDLAAAEKAILKHLFRNLKGSSIPLK